MKKTTLSLSLTFVAVFALEVLASEFYHAQVQRPSLLFGPEDVAQLKERLQKEPHASAFEHYLHTIDSTSGISSMMDTQYSALLYVLTGDRRYCLKARDLLLNGMSDWPERIGGYTPEQPRLTLTISRYARNYCMVYDMIAGSGVFTQAQDQFVHDAFILAASRLMEPGGTFTRRFPVNAPEAEEEYMRGNWNTDRYTAVGLIAMLYPEFPSSSAWLDHAISDFTFQMEHAVMPGGESLEGTRYQGAMLSYLIPFSAAVRCQRGIDLFQNPGLKGLLESMIQLQSPKDEALGDIALTPGIADADWESVWEAVLGWAASFYVDTDPAFAGRLMWAWQRTGLPFTLEFSVGNQTCSYLFIDPDIVPTEQPPLGNIILPNNLALLRANFNTPAESLMILNVGTGRATRGHQHLDRGSFSLYGFNTPLAIDPGAHSYGESLRWFMYSPCHNLVSFGDGQVRGDAHLLEAVFGENLDYLNVDLTEANAADYRRIVYNIRPDYYLLWDRIDSPKPAQYAVHPFVDNARNPAYEYSETGELNRIAFHCQNEVDLEIGILSPPRASQQQLVSIDDDQYPMTFYTIRDFVPTGENTQRPKWMKLKQQSTGQDFVSWLYPKRGDSEPLQLDFFESGSTTDSATEEAREAFEEDIDSWQELLDGSDYFFTTEEETLRCESYRDGLNHRRYLPLSNNWSENDSIEFSFDFNFREINYASVFVGLFNDAQPDNHEGFFVELYAGARWLYIWCGGAFKRNDSPNPFSANTWYRARLEMRPEEAVAILAVREKDSGQLLETVEFDISKYQFDANSLGVGNESSSPNGLRAVCELDNFHFSSLSERRRDYFHFQTALDKATHEFFLGKQALNDLFIDAQSFVVISSRDSVRQEYHLFQALDVETPMGYAFSFERPASVIIRKMDAEYYEIDNPNDYAGWIELKFPDFPYSESTRVRSIPSGDLVDTQSGVTGNSIRFFLSQAQYSISQAGAVQPWWSVH